MNMCKYIQGIWESLEETEIETETYTHGVTYISIFLPGNHCENIELCVCILLEKWLCSLCESLWCFNNYNYSKVWEPRPWTPHFGFFFPVYLRAGMCFPILPDPSPIFLWRQRNLFWDHTLQQPEPELRNQRGKGVQEALQSFSPLRFPSTPLFSSPPPGISQQPSQQHGNSMRWQPLFTQTFPYSKKTGKCLAAKDSRAYRPRPTSNGELDRPEPGFWPDVFQ